LGQEVMCSVQIRKDYSSRRWNQENFLKRNPNISSVISVLNWRGSQPISLY
jgi:hypothetical protein